MKGLGTLSCFGVALAFSLGSAACSTARHAPDRDPANAEPLVEFPVMMKMAEDLAMSKAAPQDTRLKDYPDLLEDRRAQSLYEAYQRHPEYFGGLEAVELFALLRLSSPDNRDHFFAESQVSHQESFADWEARNHPETGKQVAVMVEELPKTSVGASIQFIMGKERVMAPFNGASFVDRQKLREKLAKRHRERKPLVK